MEETNERITNLEGMEESAIQISKDQENIDKSLTARRVEYHQNGRNQVINILDNQSDSYLVKL